MAPLIDLDALYPGKVTFTRAEVARLLSRSFDVVARWVRDGKLPYVEPVPGTILIPRSVLDALLAPKGGVQAGRPETARQRAARTAAAAAGVEAAFAAKRAAARGRG